MNHILKSAAYMAAASMAIAMLFSCEKPYIGNEADDNASRTFTFQLMTPTTTRASSAADFKKVYVYDSKAGYQEQLLEQSVTDANFGSPTLTLSGGNHQLTFVATDNADAVLDGRVIRQATMGDTFLKTIDINTLTDNTSQRVILNRIVAQVQYKGEGSVTISDIHNALSLSTGAPTASTISQTLSQGQSLYTLVGEEGKVTMNGTRQIAVNANAITVIYDNDGTQVDPNDPTLGEMLVLENDTAQIYVAKMEITGVTLSDTPDPRTTYRAQMYPYRMPTRREASQIQVFALPETHWNGTRCLAYDRPEDAGYMGSSGYGTGDYYTFEWGPDRGAMSKAGTKTAYAIKPIRVIPFAPITLPFSIEADFTWSTDTTTVVNF